MRAIALLLAFCLALSAAEFKEATNFEIKLSSNLNALDLDGKTLFIGTAEGELLSLNLENKELASVAKLRRVKNFYDESAANIYSIDSFKDSLLVLASSDLGKQRLNLIKNGALSELELGLSGVKKAFFVDENTLLLAFISTEIKLYDLRLKELKSFKFTHSSLSDVRLSEDRKELVAGFESGEVEIFDIQKWQLQAKIAAHKDSIYQLDIKKGMILSCAVDRKVAVSENLSTQGARTRLLDESFLIYACVLSPSAREFAYANNDESFVKVLETKDFKQILTLSNLNFMVEHIVFLDENSLLLAGFNDTLRFYEFKEAK